MRVLLNNHFPRQHAAKVFSPNGDSASFRWFHSLLNSRTRLLPGYQSDGPTPHKALQGGEFFNSFQNNTWFLQCISRISFLLESPEKR